MMTNDDDNELKEFIQDDEVDEVDERLLPDSDEDIIALMDDNEVMEEIIERLTKERDEAIRERDKARREVCLWVNTDASGCMKSGSEETAIERGWDCFKE